MGAVRPRAAFAFMWDPAQYGRFAKERARPFFDLLAQIDAAEPKSIVDLGCGTGELTAALAKRWPSAEVVGVDSSPEMIAKAEAQVSPRLRFETKRIQDWQPSAAVDVLFSNAALHWVKPHEQEIERMAGCVAPGGTFAFQAPNQFAAPSHTIIQDVRNLPEWRPLIGSATADGYLAPPAWYAQSLAAWGFETRVWETIYYQVLAGDDAVLEWIKGTALRQPLAKLDPPQQEKFLAQVGARLRKAYPKESGGTMLPYRRLFVVATRVS